MAMQYKPTRMSKELIQKIEDKKGKKNFSQWIREAAQMRLENEQGLTPKYAEELSMHNREILAVGRNLNQLVKSINAGNERKIERALIERLIVLIKQSQVEITKVREKL